VVGQDAIGIQVPEALEVGQVAVEAVGLGEIGDRVLQRVAGEQQALARQPDHGGVVAVDVDVDELEAPAPDLEGRTLIERAGGEDERVDPGGPALVPASIASRSAASASAVRAVAITSQSAKTAVPAM
jgi:hypothetical protein